MVSKIREELMIPERRIEHVLKHKKELESIGNVSIDINKSKNLVIISSEEAVKTWQGKKVLLAISRGFNFKDAEKLFNPEIRYTQLHLRDFGGNNKKQQKRLKSRIIGRKGTCKHKIQKLTHTRISIFGKTISIIGHNDDVELARQTIEMLLSGAKHATAYHFLQENLK